MCTPCLIFLTRRTHFRILARVKPSKRLRAPGAVLIRGAGFCLFLILQLAAFFGTASNAAAQQILTHDTTDGAIRIRYTYYIADGQEVVHGVYEKWINGLPSVLYTYADGALEGRAGLPKACAT